MGTSVQRYGWLGCSTALRRGIEYQQEGWKADGDYRSQLRTGCRFPESTTRARSPLARTRSSVRTDWPRCTATVLGWSAPDFTECCSNVGRRTAMATPTSWSNWTWTPGFDDCRTPRRRTGTLCLPGFIPGIDWSVRHRKLPATQPPSCLSPRTRSQAASTISCKAIGNARSCPAPRRAKSSDKTQTPPAVTRMAMLPPIPQPASQPARHESGSVHRDVVQHRADRESDHRDHVGGCVPSNLQCAQRHCRVRCK